MKKYFKMILNPNNTRAVTALNSSELVSSYNMNIQLTNGADLNISYATKNASSYSYGPHSTVLPVSFQ